MDYKIFLAFLKNDYDKLYNYYENNNINFVDFMLALNNEFKKFFIEDDSRKNLTSFIIKKYLSNNLNNSSKSLAESKFAYCLTHIGINGLENNKNIKEVLSNYYYELSTYIDKNLKSTIELKDAYSIQKNKNLLHLKLILSQIKPNNLQNKLPSSIRSFPEDMLDLRHNDLKKVLNDNNKAKILDTDLIIQIFHLPHNDDISEEEFINFINKTKKVRLKFAEVNVKKPCFSSLLSLINQDILYSYFYNQSTDGTSTELWNHINKFNLNDIKIQKIDGNLENKKFLFVLTQDNQLLLSPFQQKDIHIRHIMLANGYPILTGGGIELSGNMNKIISVNNGTGHYKASFESLHLIKNKLINSNYDTTETVLIDVITNRKEFLNGVDTVMSNITDIRKTALDDKTKEIIPAIL